MLVFQYLSRLDVGFLEKQLTAFGLQLFLPKEESS